MKKAKRDSSGGESGGSSSGDGEAEGAGPEGDLHQRASRAPPPASVAGATTVIAAAQVPSGRVVGGHTLAFGPHYSFSRRLRKLQTATQGLAIQLASVPAAVGSTINAGPKPLEPIGNLITKGKWDQVAGRISEAFNKVKNDAYAQGQVIRKLRAVAGEHAERLRAFFSECMKQSLSSRGLAHKLWINVRDPLYFLGYGSLYIYV